MRYLLACVLVLSALSTAHALPRMSLTAGSPCTTCHVAPSGGGLRNELGFTSMSRTGAFDFHDLGLDSMHELRSNRFAADVVQTGADVRYQWVRLGRPTLSVTADGGTETLVPDYEIFQMQFQPYLGLHFTDWLMAYGSYNATKETWKGEACDEPFNGQSCYEAALQFTPEAGLPFARAGVFQPSIGVRHDDHTMFVRSDAINPGNPIIPANYAELGAEVGWQPRAWFRADLGVFKPDNLEASINQRDTEALAPISYLARVMYLPQGQVGGALGGSAPSDDFSDDFADDFDEPAEASAPINLNGWAGASLYGSGDFTLINAFTGIGTNLGGTAMFEVSRSARTSDYTTLNSMLHLSWALWEWLVVEGRVERAQTSTGGEDLVTWAYVGGLQLFPIPFVEIRPEYRYIENDVFRYGLSTIQLHLFY